MDKTQEKQVVPNTLLTICCPMPQPTAPSDQHPPVYILGMKVYGLEPLWPVLVGCPGYAPSLLVHLLSGRAWEPEKSLT